MICFQYLIELDQHILTPKPFQVNVDTPTVNKLLTALNECTEWGQIFILDSLNNYSPRDEKECIRLGMGVF